MKAIKRNKLKKYKGRILDLHRVRHEDVPELLSEFLWKNIDKNRMPDEVITGQSDDKAIIVGKVVDYLGYMSIRTPTEATRGRLVIDLDPEED